MSSNVINLFEVKRLRDADMTSVNEAPRQLDLFEGDFASLVDHASDTSAEAVQTLPSPLAVTDDKFIFAVFVETFQFQDDFLNFCKAMHPDLVVDLRVAPRLDFVRPLRRQAFELFGLCDIEYRDLLGRLGATTYDLSEVRLEEIVAAVNSLHVSQISQQPTIALFDDATFAHSCITKLSNVVTVTTLDSDAIRRLVSEGARARM